MRKTAESPQDYVRRVIAEKGLSHAKVAQRAKRFGGQLSPGYVNSIIQGHIKSPSIDMIRNLALGLGESEDDVVAVFRGKMLAEDAAFQKSIFAMLHREFSYLSENDQREVRVLLDVLKRDIQRRSAKV